MDFQILWNSFVHANSQARGNTYTNQNVILSDYQVQFIASLIDSGRYKNASEVMCEGIRVFATVQQIDTDKAKIVAENGR